MQGPKQECGLSWSRGSTQSHGSSGASTATQSCLILKQREGSCTHCPAPWAVSYWLQVSPGGVVYPTQAFLCEVVPTDPRKLTGEGERD